METTLIPQVIPTRIKNATEIVTSILEKCKTEADSHKLAIPLEEVEARVAYYTGIPRIELQQWKNKENIEKKYCYDFDIRAMILKCLSTLYLQDEQITYRSLFKKINELKLEIQDYELFEQEAILLGFEYRTVCNDTQLLMEDPKLSFERHSYINKILKFRRLNALVYYVGERYIDGSQNFNSLSQQNANKFVPSSDYLLFHAVSRNGLTSSLLTVHATKDDFFKWIVDILLQLLEPSSVVVLENSPLHGPLPKPISMYDTKNDMYKWLSNHNVPCSNSMSKFKLYELIKKNPVIDEMSRVERVLKMNGHEVLRLPTHFEDLSLIDLIWKDVKKVRLSPVDLKDEVIALLKNISQESFGMLEKEIEKRECVLHQIDTTIETNLENCLLQLQRQETVMDIDLEVKQERS